MLRPSHFEVDLKDQIQVFANALVNDLKHAGLLRGVKMIDHICYRVADQKSYDTFKHLFYRTAKLLSEANINDRPIATYKLPFKVALQDGFYLDVVELPSPKVGKAYNEGFEHVEAVVKSTLEEFMTSHAPCKFDSDHLHKVPNREISLRLPHGLVKFHEKSLEAIIFQENLDSERAKT